MDWLQKLFFETDSVAHIVLLYAIVIAAGVYLGKLKIAGIRLGVTFVLFAGLIAGHLGLTAPISTLNFMQDFGLILFVFMIGLQVGPGFFQSLAKGGMLLNLLSCLCVVLNFAVMFACYYIFFDTSDRANLPMLFGTLCGAVTNTPALGAATEALSNVFADGQIPQIASGYACAYPLGVVGLIIAWISLRLLTKTSLKEAEADLDRIEEESNSDAKPHMQYVKVENKYLEGKTFSQIREFLNRDFVCSRMLHGDVVSSPKGSTTVHLDDILYIISTEADAEAVRAFIGPNVEVNWEEHEGQKMTSRRIVITNSKINGKTLAGMHFSRLHGVNVTRITRHGNTLFASPNLALQVGDRVVVVGPEDAVERVAEKLGDSVNRLNAPNIATIFVGIILGIILGSLPIAIPNMPMPMRLGLAGGPLIVAILIGRFGYHIRLVTYTTTSANLMLREIGLVLFLASVGIKSGAGFFESIAAGDGIMYVGCGFLITFLPALIVGLVAMLMCKINYFSAIGLLAGSYTGAPALAYANSICAKGAPAVGYSTVYPLSMFIRIFLTQILVLLCC